MIRGNTARNRTAASAEDRFTFLTDTEVGGRIRIAAYNSNATISDVIEWCVRQAIDQYEREHSRPAIPRLRPGKRMKLPRS